MPSGKDVLFDKIRARGVLTVPLVVDTYGLNARAAAGTKAALKVSLFVVVLCCATYSSLSRPVPVSLSLSTSLFPSILSNAYTRKNSSNSNSPIKAHPSL